MTQPGYQPPSGSLIVRQGPLVGQSFPLTKADITVGRVMGNDVIINHPQVSRRHARLTWDGRRFIIQDLGSTNGTFVNGLRITASQPLKDGDTIGLGSLLLSFQTSVAVAEADVTQFRFPPEGAYPPPTAKGGLPRTVIVASLSLVALLVILAALVAVWFLRSGPAPVAVINSPLSGSQAGVGEQVVITSTSTDSKGVTRVELWVNGTLYHTEFSPDPQ
ncbi:MAG: FHA domain-containing protein, partial [Anaerolineae bacterium]